MQFHDRQKERHRYRHYHKVISSLFISSKRKVLAIIFTRTLRNSGKWKHFVILIQNVPNCSPLKTMSNVNLILLNRGFFDTRFLSLFQPHFLDFFSLCYSYQTIACLIVCTNQVMPVADNKGVLCFVTC